MRMTHLGPYRQRGISLIVILMLLLVMTLIGLAVLRTTLLQERMSANLRDRSLSFQTAEAALRDAEEFINTENAKGNVVGFNCTAAEANVRRFRRILILEIYHLGVAAAPKIVGSMLLAAKQSPA